MIWMVLLAGPIWLALVFLILLVVSANGRDSLDQEHRDLNEQMRREMNDG